jgi:hypothetical protein
MARNIFILGIILLLLGYGCKHSNQQNKLQTRIDSLKNEQEIVNFIREKFTEIELKNISLNSALPIFALENKSPRWSVNDVDENGYNDLIINLNLNNTYYSYVVLADSSKYNIISLTSIWEYAGSFSKFDTIKKQPVIILAGYELGNTLRMDTLVCKFGAFIDFNPTPTSNKVNKIEMHLSALGAESDHVPNINANIDFDRDSSSCHKWFSNPAYKDFQYSIDKVEMKKLKNILQYADLSRLKRRDHDTKTDQPSSKIKIYTDQKPLEISDYGLEGSYTLRELYKIVYKY